MTCIVGLVHNGSVYIGGDSAGVGGWTVNGRTATNGKEEAHAKKAPAD